MGEGKYYNLMDKTKSLGFREWCLPSGEGKDRLHSRWLFYWI